MHSTEHPLTSPTPWRDRTLTVGSRAFRLATPAHAASPRTLPVPDRDGTVAFSRPPRRSSAPDRLPAVDALRDATHAAPTLWERRPDHPDAFVLPFGLRVDPSGPTVVNADLRSDRAIAITGSERVRSALARTLIVEAATLHGPADLDLVILTSPDRAATWDWAKWLPHLRLGDSPAIWSSVDDITQWVDAAGRQAVRAHDTPDLPATSRWSSSTIPASGTVEMLRCGRSCRTPPDDLRLIALCDDPTHAPSVCTTLVTETGDDLARLHSLNRSERRRGHPARTHRDRGGRPRRSCTGAARRRRPPDARTGGTTARRDDVDLAELIDLAGPEEVLARWSSAVARPTAPVGRARPRDGRRLARRRHHRDRRILDGRRLRRGRDPRCSRSAATDRRTICGWCRSGPLRAPGPTCLSQLPHATEPPDAGVGIESERLLTRLRSVLAQPDGPARVVLVVEAERDGAPQSIEDPAMLAALVDGARAIEGLSDDRGRQPPPCSRYPKSTR